MAGPNEQVAALLQEYADLISITGGEEFKARVYERAARAVAGYPTDVSDPRPGRAAADPQCRGLHRGKDLGVRTARADAGDRTTAGPGTGGDSGTHQDPHPRPQAGEGAARAARHLLGAGTGRGDRRRQVGGAARIWSRTEENLRHGIELLRAAGQRALLPVAMSLAEEVVAALSAVPGCVRCTYAGSLRRMQETIGDVDVLAAADDFRPPDGRVHPDCRGSRK